MMVASPVEIREQGKAGKKQPAEIVAVWEAAYHGCVEVLAVLSRDGVLMFGVVQGTMAGGRTVYR
jgi:hypothetical protein